MKRKNNNVRYGASVLCWMLILFGAVTIRSGAAAPGEVVGERPYEMVMAGRTEERKPLVDFENLEGWTVEARNGAAATFARTREQQMWGQYVGKVEFSGEGAKSGFFIRPPAPIAIKGQFDSVELWVYGNNWGWNPDDPEHPRVDVVVHVRDAKGKEHEIEMASVQWEEWWLIHRKVDTKADGGIAFPCEFTGIDVKGATNRTKNALYFDSLSFYRETFKPLEFSKRPKRNIEARPEQILGINTGAGRLPFPTRPETILPTNYEKAYKNRVYASGEGEYTFEYKGKDGEVKYIYAPKKGTLGEIVAYVDGEKACRPFTEGGFKFDGRFTPERMPLQSATLAGDVLTAVFSAKSATVKYRMWIRGKTLVIEAAGGGGRTSELTLGYANQIEGEPALMEAPYLTLEYGQNGSDVALLMIKKERPVFVSAFFDWYNSNASALYSEKWIIGEGDKRKVRFNGGARYNPRTDGKRNEVFDRIFLTATPRYEEALPTVPNPPSKVGKTAGEYLWQESWGPGNYDEEHKRSRGLRSYGFEKLIQCNHEITWRDNGESFTLRTMAAPKRGGDAALQRYVKEQKALGWRSGLYTNYVDLAAVNANFNECNVLRQSDGEWHRAWFRCYTLKPARAVELDAKLARAIEKKYGSNAAYTDVHTAVTPWERCDYDARVPGAGTFANTYYAYGELLLNDQNVYGPTFSEGIFHWMYAGLSTGHYAQDPSYEFYTKPLDVAFDLLKVHPLETDIGMAWTDRAFAKREDARYADENIDRFIAATLAYGHIGWLVEERYGMRQVARSYYMVQQAAKRYAMAPVRLIEYYDARGGAHTVSEAAANGYYGDSRLHVAYANGLELIVNWSRDAEWKVPEALTRRAKRIVTLPPSGWVAFDGKGFYEASAMKEGKRIDEAVSGEYVYLDGRDQWTANGKLAVKGGAALRWRGKDVEIIDIGGNEEIGIKVTKRPKGCTAFDENGKAIGKAKMRFEKGYQYIECLKGARKYIVSF